MQTKYDKQLKALNRLSDNLTQIREDRNRLQTQVYYLIVPSELEFRLTQEVNVLKRAMGIPAENTPNPFI